MREIKFRVWTGSAMEYDVMVGRFGVFYVNPGTKDDGLDPRDTATLVLGNTKYSAEAPVMQFTGVRDRDGREIWEGDIVKLKYSPIINPLAFVEWIGSALGLTEYPEHDWGWSLGECRSAESGKVIGNIYEGIRESK